jgi:hypothetical protein
MREDGDEWTTIVLVCALRCLPNSGVIALDPNASSNQHKSIDLADIQIWRRPRKAAANSYDELRTDDLFAGLP